MPQGPLNAATSLTPGKTAALNHQDTVGNLLVGKGTTPVYNITAATVIKAAPGRLAKISVVVAGSAAGTVNDCATTGAVAAANEIGAISNTVGVVDFDWPCATGIVVTPGTGQTLAVSYV